MSDADLHAHTYYSDGTFSPEELVDYAVQKELSAIALTDHDTIEGWPRMRAACAKVGIRFVPGSELTSQWKSKEIHLLAYYPDEHHEEFKENLQKFQAARTQRIHDMTDKLQKLGVPLTFEEVIEVANCKSPGRPHVARALAQGGHCRSMDDAFKKYLKQDRPAWAPKFRIQADEAIQLIHRAGGVAVLAHPGLLKQDSVVREIMELGLDGIECFHSRHNETESKKYQDMAASKGLLVTGGSDCHGRNKGEPLLGRVRIPEDWLDQVEALAKSRIPSQSRADDGSPQNTTSALS
jgi:predicted metal-dependent phosphoesterase TrpH